MTWYGRHYGHHLGCPPAVPGNGVTLIAAVPERDAPERPLPRGPAVLRAERAAVEEAVIAVTEVTMAFREIPGNSRQRQATPSDPE
jgi:hypothetical protein